jgi:hypothetical protein
MGRGADVMGMAASPQQPEPQNREPRPDPLPPRARLEELLGRDFTEFLLDALSDAHQGRRGSSSP